MRSSQTSGLTGFTIPRLLDHLRTAEEDRSHVHGVLARLVGRATGHQRLVGIAHHQVVHVEVPRFHRQIHRLDDAGVDAVDLRRHVRGLHELDVVLDVPGPPSAVEVRHERGSSGGRIHHMVAADHEAQFGVARPHLEARRRPGERFAHEASVEVHDVAVDLQPCIAQQFQRGLVDDAVADLFEYPKRGCVDGFDVLGGDEFEPRPIVGPHVHGAGLSRIKDSSEVLVRRGRGDEILFEM
jgi:hypothetical protein